MIGKILQPRSYPSLRPFKKKEHNFTQHAKFTLIKQLSKTENVSKATLKLRLKQREDFWILKLDTMIQ